MVAAATTIVVSLANAYLPIWDTVVFPALQQGPAVVKGVAFVLELWPIDCGDVFLLYCILTEDDCKSS